MQVASSPAYIKRTLWYWASIYERQLEKSQDYHELNKCIVVSLLNFNIEKFKEIESYHTVFEIKERFKNLKLTDDLEMHFIELKKISAVKNAKDLDNLSKWTLFLNDATQEDKIKIIEELEEESEEIAMAVEILKKVSADEVKRAKYDSRLKWILEKTTIINEAERAKKLLNDANQKVEQEKQRAELEKQRAELAEKEVGKAKLLLKQSIKNLSDKLDIETIATTFSLSVKEVTDILQEL